MKSLIILSLIFLLAGCSQNTRHMGKPKIEKQVKQKVIGTFITDILDKEEGRVNNLKLCAMCIDGCRVNPGETFSFNDTVGKRTAEKGYEKARVIIDGKGEYATGGGVCQISSTLYRAAADAGLEIVERHNHEKEVHYVEIGKDAAVSYGTQDFKFKNNLKTPVIIRMEVKNSQVKAEILSEG